MSVQNKVHAGEIKILKVRSDENLADALTKAIDAKSLHWHIQATGAKISHDRHELMLEADYCREENQEDIEES